MDNLKRKTDYESDDEVYDPGPARVRYRNTEELDRLIEEGLEDIRCGRVRRVGDDGIDGIINNVLAGRGLKL